LRQQHVFALLLATLAVSAWLLLATTASAHKPSDSYLSLRVEGASMLGQWEIALRDLDYAMGLDADNDGEITWGELRRRHSAVAAFALSRLHLEADGNACATRPTAHLVDRHSDGTYEVLRFVAECQAAIQSMSVAYSLFFDVDPQHRGLARVEWNGTTFTAVFSPGQPVIRFEKAEMGYWRQFSDYFHEGVWHIWTGFDHLLFLFALLLSAVLERRKEGWVPTANFRSAFFDVLKIVTAFTAAHSITLSLAVLGYIDLPSRLVESVIAGSIVVAALNNLYPLFKSRLWILAFAFGLVHGLGFANVLRELGLPRNSLALSLVAFNLGVEAGQIIAVGAVLPLAYGLRQSRFYPMMMLKIGSVAIAVLAASWLVERSLNITILS
jgi:hydrogenase/urease accessory protein HupE